MPVQKLFKHLKPEDLAAAGRVRTLPCGTTSIRLACMLALRSFLPRAEVHALSVVSGLLLTCSRAALAHGNLLCRPRQQCPGRQQAC